MSHLGPVIDAYREVLERMGLAAVKRELAAGFIGGEHKRWAQDWVREKEEAMADGRAASEAANRVEMLATAKQSLNEQPKARAMGLIAAGLAIVATLLAAYLW